MAVFPPDEVRQSIVAGESFMVEVKGEERGPLSNTDLVQAAVCLANGARGVLLPGARWDNLDPLEFERARQVIRWYRPDAWLGHLDDQEMARGLGVVEANGEVRQVTVAGA